MTEEKKARTKHFFRSRYIVLFLMLICIAVALMVYPKLKAHVANRKMPVSLAACHHHFVIQYYGRAESLKTARTILIGVDFSKSISTTLARVAECVSAIAKPGDHLLFEDLSNRDEVTCDTTMPEFKRFRGVLRCHAFNASMNKKERLYSDLIYREEYNKAVVARFLKKAKSSKKFIETVQDLAQMMKHRSEYLRDNYLLLPKQEQRFYLMDISFLERQAKYYEHLAGQMKGKPIPTIKTSMLKENRVLARRAVKLSQENQPIGAYSTVAREIQKHQQQLTNNHRLIVVSGRDYLNPQDNKYLRHLIKKEEPVALLTVLKSSN